MLKTIHFIHTVNTTGVDLEYGEGGALSQPPWLAYKENFRF